MPYPLQLFDAENYVTDAFSATTLPLTVGGSFQNGDLRIVNVYTIAGTGTHTYSSFPGWTKVTDTNPIGTASRASVFTQTLTGSSVDGTLTLSSSLGATGILFYSAVTVRNPNLGATLSVTESNGTSGTTVPAPSVSVGANSILLTIHCATSTATITIPSAPTGMTLLGNSSAGTGRAALFAAQNFTTSGTSGAKSATVVGGALNSYYGMSLDLLQNPDVVATAGTATTETDTAAVATMSHLTTTTVTAGTALEVDTASQVFTPLTGYRISPPLAIPQSPITNSVIHWDQTTPAAGSTVTVETSVDGGQSYQMATNDQPIPRLLPGTNVWQTVQTRVTLNRLHATDPTPHASNLELRVATNASNAELVSLGLFSINNTNITITGGTTGGSSGSGGGGNGVTGSGGGNTGGGLSIEISGVDLSRSVARNSWEDVHFVDSGTNYATAIHDIIEDRLPNTSYNFASTTHTTPKLIFGMSMDSDPWQDAQDLATAIGMELFFDALGVCTLRDVPDPGTGQSVWTFSDSMNPTIASATRSLTDQTVFNYIVVYGESVDNAVPVSAVAFDDNPNSPTYYLGAYGKVPTSFTSPEITTVEQAQAAADALLNLSIGNAENVELSVVPNPALEPGDVVTVIIGELKLTGTFMINDMNTPLSAAEAQTHTVYRQTS